MLRKKAAKLDHPEWKLEDGHLFYWHMWSISAPWTLTYCSKKRFLESNMPRVTFLKGLGSALVRPQVQRRAAPPRYGLSSSVQVALQAVLGELPRAERSLGARGPTKKRNWCGFCVRSKDTKYNLMCTSCLSFICPEHTESKTVTVNCTECAAAGDNE